MNAPLLWQPDKAQIHKSTLAHFITYVNQQYSTHLNIENYTELHDWSIENREKFWEACWHFFDIKHSKAPQKILQNGENILSSKWLIGERKRVV